MGFRAPVGPLNALVFSEPAGVLSPAVGHLLPLVALWQFFVFACVPAGPASFPYAQGPAANSDAATSIR